MSRKAILAIIGLMSLAFLGIIFLQFYWIKWSIDLNAKNFDDKVIITLSEVRNKLVHQTKREQTIKKSFEKKGLKTDIDPKSSWLFSEYEPWERKRYKAEIDNIISFTNPDVYLDGINPKNLDKLLEMELQNQGISLKYDYGVLRYASKSFTVINGNHAVEFSDNHQASNVETNRSLYATEYAVKLFGTDASNAPGELRIFFPSKASFFLSSIWKSLIASILFTGLILFCFVYTISVIYRQKKISEMKNDFINNMTHEFKTPIATINLATDSMMSPMIVSNQDKIKRFAGIIKQENSRMLSQVEKVLQIATLEKSDFQLKLTDVNIHEIVHQAAENTQLKIQQRGGKVTTELQAMNPVIRGDLTHVSNVVYNILDNAIKYSTDDPKIKITTKNVSNGVQISVEDNGIGMDKESLKYIFDKFYRVHTGNLHNVKGFGLGLSYVKAIVNAHYGNIEVTSDLGKGSTFTIDFPYQMGDQK